MEQRQWIARWCDYNLNQHEYIFIDPDNRVIARIDFQLKLMGQGKKVPAYFELEEGRLINRVVPSVAEVARKEQR